MEAPRPRTRVYIDGFNFYYAAFRRGGFADYKWLDLVAFCQAALPRNEVTLVQSFTAPLDPFGGRDGQRARQDACLAALRVTPGVQAHDGQFVEHAKSQDDRVNRAILEVWQSCIGGSMMLPSSRREGV